MELNIDSYREKKDGVRESEREEMNLCDRILSQTSLLSGW